MTADNRASVSFPERSPFGIATAFEQRQDRPYDEIGVSSVAVAGHGVQTQHRGLTAAFVRAVLAAATVVALSACSNSLTVKRTTDGSCVAHSADHLFGIPVNAEEWRTKCGDQG